MIHLAGDRGTLDEKIPIWVINVNENSGKSLKENFGHENHLILGEDLFFAFTLFWIRKPLWIWNTELWMNSQKKCALAKISAHREHKKLEGTLEMKTFFFFLVFNENSGKIP